MSSKDDQMARLWNDTSNNLDAFADENRSCSSNLEEFISRALGRLKSKGSKFVDDVEYRWMASHFLLFYDDNYLSLALLDKSQEDEISLSCPTTRTVPNHLEKVICTTALTIPELKKEAEGIMNSRKIAGQKPYDRSTAVVKSSSKPVANVVKPDVTPVKTVEFKPTLRIDLQPYDRTKIDLGNAEMTRLWSINTNNLEAFADQLGRGAPDLTEFVQDMLDEVNPSNSIDESFKPLSLEKIRWVASNFLLFNSDQYLICASSWSGKDREIAKFLTKVVLETAYSIPELKATAEEINAAMLAKGV